MKKSSNKNLKRFFKIMTIILTLALIIFLLYCLKKGFFSSPQKIVKKVEKFGALGPLIFIFLQIIQVVLPIIPGGASCLAGVLLFGSVYGFIYNYVGMVIGSMVVFLLARKYGIRFVKKICDEKTVDKYVGYIRKKKFEKIFIICILLPGFPDDLLCYVAGVSKLTFKRFLIILLLAKPLALLFYSIFIDVFPKILN
jgi:uncharacterized membrane protein YdjX (TVP38/TMEM64 family)